MNDKKNLTIKQTFALAVQNHKKNNFQIAEKLYKEILDIDHDHFESIFLLGSLLAQIKNFTPAKQLLQKAIQINPNYVELHYNLGNIFNELGEYKKAIGCYEKAIQINPNYASAYNNLANALNKSGEYKKAIDCCEKAIQINPNYVELHYNLGNIFNELGEYKKAIGSYEKAIQINPNYASAYNNLANALSELREYKKAIGCYEKAIQINPNYASAYNNLANALNKSGEYKKAIDCCEKAIQINPNYASAHNNLGKIFRNLGKQHEAIKSFQKVNSTSSKAELLECTYFLNGLKTYPQMLEKLTKQDPLNLRVATMAAYVSKKENIKNIYPFCKNPLNFVFIKNLKNELISAEKFSENLLKILGKIEPIWEPSSRTTKGGYQTLGNLFDRTDSEIIKLKKMIEKQIINYRDIYKDSQDCFITKWPTKNKFYAWYVKLFKQGHQTSHIHPSGWLSGVFYLKVPELLNKNEGSIEFTLYGYDYPRDKNLPNLIHSPKIFDIALFPSSLFHNTIPFNSLEERHVVAFDLIPNIG